MAKVALVAIACWCFAWTLPVSSESYGPRVIAVDYKELYSLAEPPTYSPFTMYGGFLFSVANQQLPMVYDTNFPLPDYIDKMADVLYKDADGEPLALDVYFAKDDESPNPLILIIHGGYWKAGDKGPFYTQRAKEFVDLGYTVASINYRLAPEHTFPANIEDIRDGLIYLTEHADALRIDPTRIVTYGISAGGHLAAFLALAANSGREYVQGLDSQSLKGSISLYGMHDLSLPIQREHPFTELYIGAPYDVTPDRYVEASTVALVDPDDPPVLLIHGSIDGSVSVKNSDRLAAALENVGVPYIYDRIEGWPHVMDFFSPVGERSLWQIHRFLMSYMPSDEMREAMVH